MVRPHECAASGTYEMAAMLLAHGADANADTYASGTPLNHAYGRRDGAMIELLALGKRHGWDRLKHAIAVAHTTGA